MSKESIVFFLGIVVFIVPHIGIPDNWKVYVYALSGGILILVGYRLRQRAYIRSIEKENGERDTDSFVENNGSRANTDSEVSV